MLKEIKSGLSKNFQCVMCLYKIIYIHNCPGENNKENTKFPLSDLYPHLNVYYISHNNEGNSTCHFALSITLPYNYI